MLLTEVDTIDAVLEAHAGSLGRDSAAYRHHVYRVMNLCAALAPRAPEALAKIAIAAVFHDLGIWTAGTFDYLPPSIALARDHVTRIGRADWADEVAAMIREHHKVTAAASDAGPLVEAFRRADWIDVTCGLRTFGAPRPLLRAVFAAWPRLGFHARLVAFSLARLRTHPLSPLPMLRL